MATLPSIQSVHNSMVKHAYSLKVPKKAKASEDFLCEGFHLVEEALSAGLRCRFIFGTEMAFQLEEGRTILEAAHRAKTKCFEVPSKIIAYVSDTVTPQGLLAVAAKPLPAWPERPFSKVLAVHQVQDGGNLGTLFRSAEAAGAQGILLTDGCCDPFNPKAVRASMGSLFRLPFQTGGAWGSYMEWLKQNGFHSYGLTAEGTKSLTELEVSSPQAFWVGAEGAGLPQELLAACDERISIPMAGKVESLNVGVAASLALFWAQWKRPVP
jgi:RNA methyltransferase, TrmH family